MTYSLVGTWTPENVAHGNIIVSIKPSTHNRYYNTIMYSSIMCAEFFVIFVLRVRSVQIFPLCSCSTTTSYLPLFFSIKTDHSTAVMTVGHCVNGSSTAGTASGYW